MNEALEWFKKSRNLLKSKAKEKDKNKKNRKSHKLKAHPRDYIPKPMTPEEEPLILIQPHKEVIRETIIKSEPKQEPIKLTVEWKEHLLHYDFTPPTKPIHKAIPKGNLGSFSISGDEGG